MDGAGESRVESGAGAPQAVRGCVLEFDADAAARGVSDGLFGLLVEVVVPQAARGGGGHKGVRWVGIREHVVIRPSDRGGRGRDPRGARSRAAWRE